MSKIKNIKSNKELSSLNLKAVLFDMDGVLFDSMPNHAKAWVSAFEQLNVKFTQYEAYMREGMTGSGTINEIFLREYNRPATENECKEIYKAKSTCFESLGPAKVMPYVSDVLNLVKQADLDIYIVTGSGQLSLIDNLNNHFQNVFNKEKMVTAFDVKKGKPDPEPYLMAMQKGGYKPNEVIVVENAPLGVKSAVAAGAFTIAVNTGILKDDDLLIHGADLLYSNMESLSEDIGSLILEAKK